MLTTRPLQHADIPLLLDYWFNSDKTFLQGMGLDVSKLPSREQFRNMLETLLNTPLNQRTSYCIIWLQHGKPIGHCNTNPTTFGQDAKMHLHIWHPGERQKGLGTELVKMTLPYFFNDLQLKTLWCEPYALNPAPNKTMKKAGFEFIKEYVTTPGIFNFEQPVKQWRMTSEHWEKL
jgi:RimJ/RimL family protein N-acetyltransferase